ncbi:hypothetical protein H5410_015911 [Solanum commersonii]|uniref:Uncharacterized protein n=1 Tax=Solanum commersonii TaxID=4109 RepID=A0A9J5ZVZ3_SOLCO|nr:hypothetical protein H5410_015911 [Solanum commersonii]
METSTTKGVFGVRLGTERERNHQTGTNRYRTGHGTYRDEMDQNYRNGGSVPSHSTIYKDRIGMDRNGTG